MPSPFSGPYQPPSVIGPAGPNSQRPAARQPAAGQTLVFRDTPAAGITRDSTHVGSWASITGSVVGRPGGPSVGGGARSSAAVSPANLILATPQLTGQALTCGTAFAWIRPASFGDGVSAHYAAILYPTTNLAGTPMYTWSFLTDPSGIPWLGLGGAPEVRISRGRWYGVQVSWLLGSALRLVYTAWDSTGRQLFSLGADFGAASPHHIAFANTNPAGGNVFYAGRFGSPTVYACDTLAHALQLPADVAPPLTQEHWYVDTDTGSDSNAGDSPSQAWKTATQLNARLADFTVAGGLDATTSLTDLLPESRRAWGLAATPDDGTFTGDVIHLAGQSPLDVSGQQIALGYGIMLRCDDPKRTPLLNANVAVFAPFTAVGGHANVWKTTAVASQGSSILYVNDAPFTPVAAANLAAAYATLDSTVGTCFCDTDGTIYFHPFDGTDPNTTNNSYERSIIPAGNPPAVILLNGGAVSGLRIHGGHVVTTATGAPAASYHIEATSGAVNAAFNCTCDRMGNHGTAMIAGTADGVFLRKGVVCSRGPATGAAGWDFHVDFSQFGSAGTVTGLYVDCSEDQAVSVAGQAAGDSTLDHQFYLSHNTGGVTFYGALFDGCTTQGTVGMSSTVASHFAYTGTLGTLSCDIPDQEIEAYQISTASLIIRERSGAVGGIGASTAAAGSTSTDAAVLPAATAGTYPTTAANGTRGVRLNGLDNVTGREIRVGNGVAAQILKVYPPTGGTINGAAVDAAFSSASGKGVILQCLDMTANSGAGAFAAW